MVIDNKTHEKYKVKIEFVFSKPLKGNNEPILNHYFVLDPRSTADDMANDQEYNGRCIVKRLLQ